MAEIASAGLKTRASFRVSTAAMTVASHIKVLLDPPMVTEHNGCTPIESRHIIQEEAVKAINGYPAFPGVGLEQ